MTGTFPQHTLTILEYNPRANCEKIQVLKILIFMLLRSLGLISRRLRFELTCRAKKLMAELICMSHKISILMYNFLFVAKYRRLVVSAEVIRVLYHVCFEISMRFEIRFMEMETEGDHVFSLSSCYHRPAQQRLLQKLRA